MNRLLRLFSFWKPFQGIYSLVGLFLLTIFILPLRGAETSVPLSAYDLTCSGRSEPSGISEEKPGLSWKLASPVRGAAQSAYQVLVASTPSILEKDRGDLWDSGKVTSSLTQGIPYGGKPLLSSETCHWKVRTWDQGGQSGPWSTPSAWTMGVLKAQDWGGAQWIGVGPVDQGKNQLKSSPALDLKGFHSKPTVSPSGNEWVQITLDKEESVRKICIYPVSNAGISGFGFPKRFKIEVSSDPDFHSAKTVIDRTGADFPNPGKSVVEFPLDGSKIRALRITETVPCDYPDRKPNERFLWALNEVQLLDGDRDVARGQKVTASSSVEGYGWGAAALTAGAGEKGKESPSQAEREKSYTIRLRRELTVRPGLRRALFHVSGLGHYALEVNGKEPQEGRPLTPGWTDYRKSVLYDTLDLTPMLKEGTNALGVTLDGGMYFSQKSSRYSAGGYTNYGPLALRGKLELQYNDGTSETIVTDGSWSVGPSPIVFSSVYGGEDYDARREQAGWSAPGFRATPEWTAAIVLPGPSGLLRGASDQAWLVRQIEPLELKSSKEIAPGKTVYDFGQNASTYPEIVVSGPAGSSVRLTPSEITGATNGDIQDDMCRGKAFYTYTLSGHGSEHWNPRFFYRGARFLKAELFPAAPGGELPKIESIRQQVIHAQAPAIGRFACSNELFNRIYELIRWAQRSNMMSVLTDCPHREKRGWLEEDHLNGPALRYNFNLRPLFGKIVQDIIDAQNPDGLVPDIAPEYTVFKGGFRDSPEWGSSALFVPWQGYVFDGDKETLGRAYETMKRYEAYLLSKSKDLIVDHGLGDWFDIGPKGPGGPSMFTPKAVTATAYFYQNARILEKTARLLGRPEEEKTYADLAASIREKFIRKFFNPATGQVSSGSQCANAIALVFGLVPEEYRGAVLENLVKDVQAKGLTAGDVGYVYLIRALADGGRSDVIYTLNNQSDKPGYGYQLKNGATSLTESWSGKGHSQNHFMLGQINEWFFHDLAGIQPDPEKPGFAHIIIKPTPVGDLTWAGADYDSIRGPISSWWKREGVRFTLDVSIPPGCTATVELPCRDTKSVTEGNMPAAGSPGILGVKENPDGVAVEIASGKYSFACDLPVSSVSNHR